jgi:hypothetical protein
MWKDEKFLAFLISVKWQCLRRIPSATAAANTQEPASSSRTELTGTLFFSHPRITPSDVTWNFCWITRDQRHIREYKSLHCRRPIVIIIVMITLRVLLALGLRPPIYTLCAAGAANSRDIFLPVYAVCVRTPRLGRCKCFQLFMRATRFFASNRQTGNWVPKSISMYNPILTGSIWCSTIFQISPKKSLAAYG